MDNEIYIELTGNQSRFENFCFWLLIFSDFRVSQLLKPNYNAIAHITHPNPLVQIRSLVRLQIDGQESCWIDQRQCLTALLQPRNRHQWNAHLQRLLVRGHATLTEDHMRGGLVELIIDLCSHLGSHRFNLIRPVLIDGLHLHVDSDIAKDVLDGLCGWFVGIGGSWG